MNRHLGCALVLSIFVGSVHAEGALVSQKQGSVGVQPDSAEVSRSITIVRYSDSSQQVGESSFNPKDPSSGLQVDFRPFDSNFNMSAANFQTQPASNLSKSSMNRTYLGVGWKKLVDDAQNLGVRVDIGAVYDEKFSAQALDGSTSPESNNALSPVSSWQPVISLGVSYRF